MQVVLLQGAIDDLLDIKSSDKNWATTKKQIKAELALIGENPLSRSVPPEIQDISITEFHQGLSKYHRMIYEMLDNAVYVHIICHQRKDMTQILLRRMSRFS